MAMTWFMTGVGSGLGKATAAAALNREDRVFGLLRSPDAAVAFENSAPGRAIACMGDVTDRAAVFAGIARAEGDDGIDVLMNNAGNVLEGYVEDVDPAAVRAIMEVNLLGPLHAIQAALPGMRRRKRGHIVNISSGGGIVGVPWVGLYSASKFALEGMSEALAAEVGPLGIAVTIVEPGAFRTNLLLRDHVSAQPTTTDYEESAGKTRARISSMGGSEPGDPEKFARALLKLVDAERPPLRIALGEDAIGMALHKAASLRLDVEAGRELGSGLGLPPA